MSILLNGRILPIGRASAVEGLLSTGPTLSSFLTFYNQYILFSFLEQGQGERGKGKKVVGPNHATKTKIMCRFSGPQKPQLPEWNQGSKS